MTESNSVQRTRWSFIGRLDDFLLKNYPNIWRLKIHIVLPAWLFALILLSVFGYSEHINPYELAENREIGDAKASIITFLITLIGLIFSIFWRNRIARNSYQMSHWAAPWVEFILLYLCWLIIFSAFLAFSRSNDLKKIVTARRLAPYQEYFSHNNYFVPIYLPHQDSTKFSDPRTYFRNGEQLYHEVVCNSKLYEPSNYKIRNTYELEGLSGNIDADSLISLLSHTKKINSKEGQKGINELVPTYALPIHLSDYATAQGILQTFDTASISINMPKFKPEGPDMAEAKQLLIYRYFIRSLNSVEQNEYLAYVKKISILADSAARLVIYERKIAAMPELERYKKTPAYVDSIKSTGMMSYGTRVKNNVKVYSEGEDLFFGSSISDSLWSLNDMGMLKTLKHLKRKGNLNGKLFGIGSMIEIDETDPEVRKKIEKVTKTCRPDYDILISTLDSLSSSFYKMYLFLIEDQYNPASDYKELPEVRAQLDRSIHNNANALDSIWLKEYLLRGHYSYSMSSYWYGKYLDYYQEKVFARPKADTLETFFHQAGIYTSMPKGEKDRLLYTLDAMDTYNYMQALSGFFRLSPSVYVHRQATNLAFYLLVFFLTTIFFLLIITPEKSFQGIVVGLLIFSGVFLLSNVDKYLTGNIFNYFMVFILSAMPVLLYLCWTAIIQYKNSQLFIIPIILAAIGWFGFFRLKGYERYFISEITENKYVSLFWERKVLFSLWVILFLIMIGLVARKSFYPKKL